MRNILLGSLLVLSSCDFIFQTKEAAPDDAGSGVTGLAVTALEPPAGSDIGGYVVRFIGHGFKPAMGTGAVPTVTFNDIPAQCSPAFTDTELLCTVPSLLGVSGPVNVHIVNELPAGVMTSFLLPTDTSPFAVRDFPLPAQLAGIDAIFVGTGDWDGDGHTDILMMGKNEVVVCYGDGAAGLPTTCDTIPLLGGPPTKGALGDVSGDGVPDLAYLQNGIVQIQVMSPNGNQSFVPKGPFGTGNISDFVLADLDGDGKSDLAIGMKAAPIDGKVEIYTHLDQTPSAAIAFSTLSNSAGAEVSLAVGKGTGAATNDLLISWPYQGSRKYDLRRWDNVSSFGSYVNTLVTGAATSPVNTNVNGDSLGDAVFVRVDTKEIMLAPGKATGFNAATILSTTPLSTAAILPLHAVSLLPGAVAGTSADLIVSYQMPGSSFDIYLNPGSRGRIGQPWPAPIQVPHPFAAAKVLLLASADFNRDGAMDLIVVGQHSSEVKLLVNRKRLK